MLLWSHWHQVRVERGGASCCCRHRREREDARVSDVVCESACVGCTRMTQASAIHSGLFRRTSELSLIATSATSSAPRRVRVLRSVSLTKLLDYVMPLQVCVCVCVCTCTHCVTCHRNTHTDRRALRPFGAGSVQRVVRDAAC
jgi:hypothetical protein